MIEYSALMTLLKQRRKHIKKRGAEVAHRIGISPSYFSRLENCEFRATPEQVKIMLQLYWPDNQVLHMVLMLSVGIVDSELIQELCNSPDFIAGLTGLLLSKQAVVEIPGDDAAIRAYGYAHQVLNNNAAYLVSQEVHSG